MKVKTAAKINLVLDVVGKRPDGYHEIESVFQTVGLYDEVTVELADGGISVSCEVPERFAASDPIPCDERNIAFKTAKKFLDENSLDTGVRIHIKKGIPSQAGMGGGSTDAAAVLYCLNSLTGKKLRNPERIGADVPFFLTGGTAYVSGIGESIEPIAGYSGKILVIAKGTEGVSTAEAYRLIDSLVDPVHPDAKGLAAAVNGDPERVPEFVGNLFETAIHLAEVDKIKSVMNEMGARSACMTGSGSAVFGIFDDRSTAEKCAADLAEKGFFSTVCETVSKSFEEIK